MYPVIFKIYDNENEINEKIDQEREIYEEKKEEIYMLNPWIYNNQPYKYATTQYIGFIYCITCIQNGKKYIGKKIFWNTTKKKNEAGKNIYTTKESDWKTYYGSSKHMKIDLQLYGALQFKREIIMLCENKFDMMYYETKEIIDRDALLDEQYYNLAIYCRLIKRKKLVDDPYQPISS